MNKSIVYVLLIICSISTTYAQSVEELVNEAVENNPGLESIRLFYESAKQQANQIDFPDPRVNYGLAILPIETRSGSQRFKLGISQSIPWKGLLEAKRKVAGSKAEILSQTDELISIEIEFAISAAYNNLILIADQKEIIISKLELLDVLEEIAKSAVSSGKGQLSHVLLIQRNRESLLADKTILDKQRESSQMSINRWLGRNLRDTIIIENNPYIDSSIEDFHDFIESNHPQVQIFNSQIKASDTEIELIKYESKPKIGIGIDYSWISARDGIDINGNGRDAIMTMGSVTIPFHTRRFDHKRQEERVKQEGIESAISNAKQIYHEELAQALNSIEIADLEIEKMTNLKNITQATLELMHTEYASDGTRFEELIRLEMEMIEYELQIVQAKYKKLMAQATFNKFN